MSDRVYPKWLSILEPHKPQETGNYIVRCKCGRVRWLKAGKKVMRHHSGHMSSPLEDANFYWWLRFKLGLLDWRTVDEFLRDLTRKEKGAK